MLTQKLRRSGHGYVVSIPKAEVERLGLREGQLIGLDVYPVEIRRKLPADLQSALDASFARNEAGYRYLADR